MNTIKVVSIDDHPLIHEAIRSLLSGYNDIEHVGEGYVGDHLFPLLEQHQPDVLILDLIMPQHEDQQPDGRSFVPLQALATLRRRFPEVSVIILSQYLHRGVAQGAISHGVKGYLLKSDNLSLNLPSAIKHVSKGGVYFSTAFSKEMFNRPDRMHDELLTDRQKEVILAIAKSPDLSYAQIAANLHLEPRTVKGHLSNAYKSLGVTNITACVIRCMQLGIIPLTVTETGVHIDYL
jgi:two-component system NarL family response regulator